ncbi:MAG: NAD(P)/FAD-dependent oxidoreductase, partial [Gammaproteobacteria bacterium]|nr:NAD(P)/FAD-dependent oxidoreductase [Gammaproteobacteria bacterium]
MHYIIVGAGPAGVIACETIRKRDQNAQITLLKGQKEPPYSRMAIPYFLEEKIAENGTYLRHDTEYFSDLDININSELVSEVNTEKNSILLSDANTLVYDKLLLATGATAVLPPIDGIDSDHVHTCWTLEDARNIAEKAVPGSSLVLMGAGFIGCIILQSLLKRGVDLTVVEMGDRMVPRMMDDTAGGLLKAWCESKGVKILTGEQVTSISETNTSQKQPLQVNLKNSESLFADLLICAAGVKSNTGFLENSAIALDQGILVNQFLQTNIDNVYAAGDAAQGLDFSDQSRQVQAIQPTAVEHGRIAAVNMVENNSCVHHGSINMNILDTMGLISTSFGQWMGVGGGEESILLDEKNYR